MSPLNYFSLKLRKIVLWLQITNTQTFKIKYEINEVQWIYDIKISCRTGKLRKLEYKRLNEPDFLQRRPLN